MKEGLDSNDRALAEVRASMKEGLDRNDRALAEVRASMKEGFQELKSQVKEVGAASGKRLEQGESRLRALEDSLLRAQTLPAVAIFLYGVVQKWEAVKSFVSSLLS